MNAFYIWYLCANRVLASSLRLRQSASLLQCTAYSTKSSSQDGSGSSSSDSSDSSDSGSDSDGDTPVAKMASGINIAKPFGRQVAQAKRQKALDEMR